MRQFSSLRFMFDYKNLPEDANNEVTEIIMAKM